MRLAMLKLRAFSSNFGVRMMGRTLLLGGSLLFLCQCGSLKTSLAALKPKAGTKKEVKPLPETNVVVSVEQQKLALYGKDGKVTKLYPVSTSKFGLGDKPGTYNTPLGLHEVVAKIGHGARSGTVYKGRSPTGEVVKPNSPGRDPIVSRIMWLRGMEEQNRNAYRRCIYIHGTADEQNVGRPVSYGCVRMKSQDVMELFEKMGIGSRVLIAKGKLPKEVTIPDSSTPPAKKPADQPPIFLNPQPGPAAPEEKPETPAPYERPMILAQNTKETPEGFKQKVMPDGTVIYTPNSTMGTLSRLVLKSKRGASDGLR